MFLFENMLQKLKAVEYFDSWNEILEFLLIVEVEAVVFEMHFVYNIFYNELHDKYKVEIVYENR